jgi:outer membrane protein OmpA-like peptidoglycan-associated protein
MQEETLKIADKERRIEAVRSLFKPNEADVLLQGDEIIVRLYGFSFDPGTAYVDAKNFSLLNHILSAVNKFPEAEIIVSGHTDSMGSNQKNMMLSIERAENVAEYLRTTAGLDSQKVDYKGYGETQPVASNDTSEGRAKNRRIEVRILPNWEALSPETEIVQQRTEGQQK